MNAPTLNPDEPWGIRDDELGFLRTFKTQYDRDQFYAVARDRYIEPVLFGPEPVVPPYCAKLAGPCPDGCAGVAVQCGRPGELHGDCWRVKQPVSARALLAADARSPQTMAKFGTPEYDRAVAAWICEDDLKTRGPKCCNMTVVKRCEGCPHDAPVAAKADPGMPGEAWRQSYATFAADYGRYVDGDVKMPWAVLRDSLAAFMEECAHLSARIAPVQQPTYLVRTEGYSQSKEGTGLCTCSQYPHAPWCGPWSTAPVQQAVQPIGPTGREPEMLQDADRKLSIALSNTPGARLHATEAAATISAQQPDKSSGKASPNKEAELTQDAMRYRWLRDSSEHWQVLRPDEDNARALIQHDVWSKSSCRELDEAIDAAMRSSDGGTGDGGTT